jgi:hypothetical protein
LAFVAAVLVLIARAFTAIGLVARFLTPRILLDRKSVV